MKDKKKLRSNRVASDAGLATGDRFEHLGIALVELGNAMQDRNTTITKLLELEIKAGVRLQFRIVGG